MVWGGIGHRGLVPSNGPLFVDEMKEDYLDAGYPLGPKGGINAQFYRWMLVHKVRPEVQQKYGPRCVDVIWEDDGAKIHR